MKTKIKLKNLLSSAKLTFKKDSSNLDICIAKQKFALKEKQYTAFIIIDGEEYHHCFGKTEEDVVRQLVLKLDEIDAVQYNIEQRNLPIDTKAQRERLGWKPLDEETRTIQFESNIDDIDKELATKNFTPDVKSDIAYYMNAMRANITPLKPKTPEQLELNFPRYIHCSNTIEICNNEKWENQPSASYNAADLQKEFQQRLYGEPK